MATHQSPAQRNRRSQPTPTVDTFRVYLHYVLDLWFEREVMPRLRGEATLIRYCDDFIIAFERHDDAERMNAVLVKRFERYGLALHPDKTRLLAFARPRAWTLALERGYL